MTRPTSAFITFENDLSKLLAAPADDRTRRERNATRKILGESLKFKNASEPSDIIWENRHIEPRTRTVREVVVTLVIGLALLLSFAVVFAGRKAQANVYAKYPVPASCAPFYDNYGAALEGFAVMDYDANKSLEEAGQAPSYAGYLQCFCDKEALDGAATDKTYGDNSEPIC